MANTLTKADLLNAANAYPVGLKHGILTGDAAATNIPVTGIATTDKIISVVQFLRSATPEDINFVDLTSEASITSAGNIQLSTTDTTGTKLEIEWYDKA